ncbi:HNH endonuclease [Rhodohalobacter sp. SW132]|uniref:HNH endonuclease signature motif containing protein n=1 Tax=Rhodohalobacter sp. SW132 TaxID=2293433 RepID=UPI000E252810|nr:HNH endonuclease signature motif containing protein [Rhodohalobacter sp. SW132]REL32995.1 HNH endonuclease [Rhodohalobacter sp. SW132]
MIDFYTFTSLQETVEEQFKVEIDPEGGEFKVEEVIYRLQDHDISKVKFVDNDIFLKEGDDLIKGFLVKEENYFRAYYDRELKRKSHLPKFHTTKCDTLSEMESKGRFDGVYIFSNKSIERKEAPEGGSIMSDLRVCKNCVKEDPKLSHVIFTKEFVEEHLSSDKNSKGFKKSELPKQYEKDEWGYVNGWDKVSLRYRANKNFKCEKCDLDLSKSKYFLEVHHINHNKTDNRESNLQCLCTGCHSRIDEYHENNFKTKPENREKLNDYRRLFK